MDVIAILHLEDSPLDADLIRSWLDRDGFAAEIARATDREGYEAALRARRYDVILADYSLPDYDGQSAMLLARELAPETPFIFVSGRLGEEVAIESLKRGATDYVLKQRLERLSPAVRRALAEARERDERRRAEAALREGEGRHRQILDSITDYAVISADPAGRIRSWSAGAERLFGLTESETAGGTVERIYTPEDVRNGVPHELHDRAMRGGRGDVERWYLRRDGSRFWGSGVVVPLLDDDGRLRGYTTVIRDMTERKRAEDALREADRRKDEFLAMLSHELRDPMAAMKNAVTLARRPGLLPDRVAWAEEIIEHQVNHLARLVDDLLDVSRIERGRILLRKESLDAVDVARRAVETTRPLMEERGHDVSLTVTGSPLRVEADPTRLEQILVNLLTNAAKYTEQRGHLTLGVSREGGSVVFRVKDDGIGMSPELLERVFDLFSQADDSLDRTRGGLGIGLTIVRRLVEMHGGSVSAHSDGPGLGSEFRITLPASGASADGLPAPAALGPAASADGAIACRVLVVDDNTHTAWSLAELLRISGHTVCTAHDGAEALEAALRERPDVILLDIGLPVLDGYQVARRLRTQHGMTDILLVAITGYGEDQACRRCRDAGFDHHLVKPVDLDHLLGLLASHTPAARRAGPAHPGTIPFTPR